LSLDVVEHGKVRHDRLLSEFGGNGFDSGYRFARQRLLDFEQAVMTVDLTLDIGRVELRTGFHAVQLFYLSRVFGR
jgi:hypothetical protein